MLFEVVLWTEVRANMRHLHVLVYYHSFNLQIHLANKIGGKVLLDWIPSLICLLLTPVHPFSPLSVPF